jgi:hypothetical protein
LNEDEFETSRMIINQNEQEEESYDHEMFEQMIMNAYQTHMTIINSFQSKNYPKECYQYLKNYDFEIRKLFKHAVENPTLYLGNDIVKNKIDEKYNQFKMELNEIMMPDSRKRKIEMQYSGVEESNENQNLHPNMLQQNFEESKLENSLFQESAISNAQNFNQKTPNKSPFTPNSVNKVHKDQNGQVEINQRPSLPNNPQNISPKYIQNPNFDNGETIEEQEEKQRKEQQELQELLDIDIRDKLVHKKWQIRKIAYEEIAQMFEGAANGEVYQEYAPNNDVVEFNPLERYQEWLIRMIRDSNLSAQQEGLKTLFVYLKSSPDIRSAMLSTLPDLLDKINHNKAQFSKITTEIIEIMFERGMGTHIAPELLKRFKNAKNDKITIFSIEILRSIIQKDVYMEVVNLRHLFNGIANTLVNPDNHIRDAGINLLKELFIRISDDVASIVKKLRNLRPVLKKQIKADLEQLNKQEGCAEYRIFSLINQKQNFDTEESCDNIQEQIQEDMKILDISQENNQQKNQEEGVDLNSLAPEDFDKLNFVLQIKQKKDILTEFRKKLQNVEVLAKSNNYKIYNLLIHALEDTNALIFQEAIKIVEILANLNDQGIKGKLFY